MPCLDVGSIPTGSTKECAQRRSLKKTEPKFFASSLVEKFRFRFFIPVCRNAPSYVKASLQESKRLAAVPTGSDSLN
jgi:hypothetical protein